MKNEQGTTKDETVKLTKTERKLLEQIEAQAKTPKKAEPKLFKFLTNTVCGFYY